MFYYENLEKEKQQTRFFGIEVNIWLHTPSPMVLKMAWEGLQLHGRMNRINEV